MWNVANSAMWIKLLAELVILQTKEIGKVSLKLVQYILALGKSFFSSNAI